MSEGGQTDAIRVVIADDQSIIREGLTTILDALDDVAIVGVVADGAQAIDVAPRSGANVVLMDLQMPEMDGIEATRRLRDLQPDIAVVVLTTYTDDDSILEALAAGAIGYLTKHATAQDIHRALSAAVDGQAVVDRAVQARLIERAVGAGAGSSSAPELPDGLSVREGEVLALIAEGLSNEEIASRLFVSRATVKTHVNQILRKTGCRDRPQAIVYAFHHDAVVRPQDG